MRGNGKQYGKDAQMKSTLNDFFEVLATRMGKENDLSDMTYALCEANQGFRRFFIEYFFGSGCFDTTKALIEREVSSDDSRPDFLITLPDRSIYLIEVKKRDAKHHFDQYRKMLKSKNGKDQQSRLGYIASYEINKANLSEADRSAYEAICNDGQCVKVWIDFFDKLAEAARESEQLMAVSDLVEGYLAYGRATCYPERPDEGWKFDAEDLAKAFAFDRLIAGCVDELQSEKQLARYQSSYAFQPRRAKGVYVNFNAMGKNDYAFVGVDYAGENARFSVLFEDAKYWGERVCRLFDGRRGEDGIDVSEQGVRFTMMTTAALPTKDQIKRFLVTVGRRIGDVDAAESIDEDVQLGGNGSLPSLNCYRAFRNIDLEILDAIESSAHTNVGISYYNHPSSRDQLGRCGEYVVIKTDGGTWYAWIGVTDAYGLKPQLAVEVRSDWSRGLYQRLISEGWQKGRNQNGTECCFWTLQNVSEVKLVLKKLAVIKVL